MSIQKQITRINKKIDKAIQQNRKPGLCECCGSPADIIHHFVQKSRSQVLRHNPINHIQICNKCHTRHHTAGDPDVHAAIIRKRGWKWYDKLNKIRQQFTKRDKALLEQLQKLYDELNEISIII